MPSDIQSVAKFFKNPFGLVSSAWPLGVLPAPNRGWAELHLPLPVYGTGTRWPIDDGHQAGFGAKHR